MTVIINNKTNKELTKNQMNLINKAVEQSLLYEGFTDKCEISVLIVDNEEIKSINKQFRKIDKETDVLSFPQLTFSDFEVPEKNENGEIILGDIVISFEKAYEQSKEYGHTIDREIAFLTVHSMLHLLGYDHMLEDDEKIMFLKQKEILNNLKISR